ncbi:hypothetical protein AVEN_129031-1 [Araneus ventricosus]|uniref:Uncharacterized protein n=1 Tax=Araneus ventricosus TaxID=182803 RepID=A0A4Y2HKL5_ARAVE|nr:hypothetical protein AVEN_129031-1 [Araneus ventricosus]
MCTVRRTDIARTKNETFNHPLQCLNGSGGTFSQIQARTVLQDCSGEQCASMCPHKKLSQGVRSGDYGDNPCLFQRMSIVETM